MRCVPQPRRMRVREKARAVFPQLGSISLPVVDENPFSLGARAGLEILQSWGAVTVEARFATATLETAIVLVDAGLRVPGDEAKIEGVTLVAGVRW